MKRKIIPGINIQWPISELILSGAKTIETRKYPIPQRFIGKKLALIETPGSNGKFKARIRGIIIFDASFEYIDEEEFYKDSMRHKVNPGSKWQWSTSAKKFGWPVRVVKVYARPIPPPKKRGIIFARECAVV